MLFARRSVRWFFAALGLALSCNETVPPPLVVPTQTSVLITPEAFLGGVACGAETGGLLAYQATLIDVTVGLGDAETLPSSPVVDCASTVVFEDIEINHRYAARIAAFDRAGLLAKSEGSPVVVDGDGNEVAAKWSTTCYGHDGEIEQALGGAGGQGEGGATTNTSLGVLAREHAVVPIRGCAPLSGEFSPELTGVRLDLTRFLGSLSCGSESGEVLEYSATLVGDDLSGGGAGGMGGSSASPEVRTECDVPFVLRSLEANQWVTLEVLAFEAGGAAASWATTCEGRTELGTLIDVSCDRLRAL
jgi:hypothetical protein